MFVAAGTRQRRFGNWSTVRAVAQTSRQRLLEYAAERLGRKELATRLKVDEAHLDAWMLGAMEVPNRKLLALADLIDELDKQRK
jgi:hypothetical protein